MCETQTFNSVGHISSRFCIPVYRVQSTAAAMGIEPTARINGIDHYSDDQADKMLSELVNRAKPGLLQCFSPNSRVTIDG